MDDRLHYGIPLKVLHWLVVVLLAVQFPIGWFMPDVHAGPPGRVTSECLCGLRMMINSHLGYAYIAVRCDL